MSPLLNVDEDRSNALTNPSPAERITLPTHFPRLRVLHLRDGSDAEIAASLAWLGALLHPPQSPLDAGAGRQSESALEELSLDHSMIRRDLLAVPAATWRAVEGVLLGGDGGGSFRVATSAEGYVGGGGSVDGGAMYAEGSASTNGDASDTPTSASYPYLRTVTFKGYQKFSIGAPDAFEHFSKTIRERLPRLVERGVLRVRR
jgi:hypothetical protein